MREGENGLGEQSDRRKKGRWVKKEAKRKRKKNRLKERTNGRDEQGGNMNKRLMREVKTGRRECGGGD